MRMSAIGLTAFMAVAFGSLAPDAKTAMSGHYFGDNIDFDRDTTVLAADVGAPMLGDILKLNLGAGDIARTIGFDAAGTSFPDRDRLGGAGSVADKVDSSMMYIVLPTNDGMVAARS